MRPRSAIGKRTSEFSGDAQKTEKKIRNENSVRKAEKLARIGEEAREDFSFVGMLGKCLGKSL